ncbi:proline-rich transmembrane protein 3 [Pangasianodon hypophthalmus]|uniref:proline-rich transmembrane protein 3 n=1 Tax=Pangasianodon hypophthalmus TaxID=310915 RepID=UPI002307B60B|nr:proline-rich transmembrane protein 3 [Pangasianodon hypophthalmus]XP_026781177.2 proline-rich transmembrane protein 3 [Pangasianodon hypophthalmus]
MKHGIYLLIRCALGRQSTSMALLLVIPLLLALIQPVASQVYVNSSSYAGSTRMPALEQADQTQESLRPSHPIGWTEVPDQKMGPRAKTERVTDRNASVGVFEQGDTISNGQPEAINNTVEESSTKPSKIHMKVDLTAHSLSPNNRTKGGPSQTQRSTVRPVTTVPTQKTGGYSEKETTTFIPIKQDSGGTTIADAETMPKKAITDTNTEDWSMSAVLRPTVISLLKSSIDSDDADQGQTSHTFLTAVSTTPIKPTIGLVLQDKASTATLASTKPSTSVHSPMFADRMNITGADLGAKQGNTTATGRQSKESPSTTPSLNGTTTVFYTNMTDLELRTPPQRENPANLTTPQPKSTTQLASTKMITNQKSEGAASQGASCTTSSQQRAEINPSKSTTKLQSTTDTTTSQSTTLSPLMGRGRLLPMDNEAGHVEKEHTLSLGNIPSVKPGPTPPANSCATGLGLCPSPEVPNTLSEITTSNRTLLVWADLSRTLSFAWELHVFGSAALYLLLTAGSALGLALAPSMLCPHRGALALANGLLLLTGAIRAIYFLVDPYGSRLLLPLSVITALYTLPLPLLIWVHSAMVVLVLKGAEVVLLPPPLQHPPLLAVMAILQCTLLLAADLLSPALSPAVPVVLQSLTLTAGLVLCLGYIFLVLPRLTNVPVGHTRDKGLGRSKMRVLVRVLAGCALLGALCCLLHAYTCFWLYGLLGDWRHFRWAWWLVQFWARLLELTWAFCLLLLSSWVFWRSRGGQMGRAPGQGAGAAGDLTSPCSSSNSSETHTCWAKIVQSLKGRPCRKSDSNGVGGANGGGVAGEMPNNWAGQERSGVDISKSLIRNRDPPKESNRGRNQRSSEGSSGSLLRLQALSRPHQCSVSSSLDREKESAISLYDFDLRPPSPIDLTRSIDEALHREHLLRGGSLFHPLGPPSPPPSPETWMRRNSDPQIMLSESSDEHTLLTESSAGLNRSIPSAVPSRQVTAPPTPTHQGPRWTSQTPVPSSISCPISLHPSPSMGRALSPSTDDTRPFLTPDLDKVGSDSGGERGYLRVSRHDDSASVTSEIIDL